MKNKLEFFNGKIDLAIQEEEEEEEERRRSRVSGKISYFSSKIQDQGA
jgi:hypothetical protein